MLVESVSAQRPQVGPPAVVEAKPQDAEPSPGKKEEEKPDVKLLQQVLDVAQEHFQVRDIGLQFTVHEQTGRVKVTVLDKETGETIREVPPQQILDLMAKIDEMMGILYDQKA
jgi:flagellar protein FlaG